MKRIAFTLFFGGEFHGVFPSSRAAMKIYDSAVERFALRHGNRNEDTIQLTRELLGAANIQKTEVTRERLERLKDDEVSDSEWSEYEVIT